MSADLPHWRTLPELVLFRHGKRLFDSEAPNLSSRELPLLPGAAEELRASAVRMQALGVGSPVRCVASPLMRTRETAHILVDALAPGLIIEHDDRLREMNDAEARNTDLLLARAVSFLHSLNHAPGPVLVVTHGAVLQAMSSALGAYVHHVPMGSFLLWRNGTLVTDNRA